MTGVLLDTNAALWVAGDNPRLGKRSRALLQSRPVWVSSASVWEVELKQRIGRLRLDDSFVTMMTAAGVRELPITWAHAARIDTVALAHNDPFDRLLVAQAKAESLTFVTADSEILRAGLPQVWDAQT